MTFDEIKEIVVEANKIYRSKLPWDTKYDLIFSENISRSLFQVLDASSYYDPDTTYEEDVEAFMRWLNEKFPLDRGDR